MLTVLTGFLLLASPLLLLYLFRQSFRRRRYDWTRQCMLITGGAQGIGRNVVELCLGKGCKSVIIVDIKEPEFSLPKNVSFVKCDISDRANVQRLEGELREKELIPTILINNAGIWNGGKRLGELQDEQIERVINVNMMAPFWITRAFLPAMLKARHGRIVNVSSVLGLGGVAKMTDYCASKFGLFGMNEALRMELKADGYDDIICTVVCPFHVGTTLFANKVRWNHRWLMSTLCPSHVARQIVQSIETGQEEVWLPKSIGIIPILRTLPTMLYDRVHKILGSDDSIVC